MFKQFRVSSKSLGYSMNRILVILAIFGFCCSITDACKKLWTEHNGSCYYVTNDKVLWNDAVEKCIQLGGHLVTITSKEENDFVKSLAKSRAEIWLGGMNVGNGKKTWRWASTFERLSFSDWGSGQPNNRKDESCLGMYRLTWHDFFCGSTKHYSVCEIDNREVKEVLILKAIFDKNQ